MNKWPKKDKGELTINNFVNNIITDLQITKSDRIVSMGSCFAREIKNYLIENKYNYTQKETDKNCWVNEELFPGDKGTPKYAHASCAWERVYNTASMKQIVEASFNEFVSHTNRIQPFEYNNKQYFSDLLRSRVVYRDYETAEKDIDDHNKISRSCLTNASLVILTLGLTECHYIRDLCLASLDKWNKNNTFVNLDYDSNLYNIEYIINKITLYNPKVRFLITVSPIHLLASFRDDVDVMSASCASKSTLRAVANELTKNKDNVYYFPSYEIATMLMPMLGYDVYPNGHHINKDIVKVIMKAFDKKCLIKE